MSYPSSLYKAENMSHNGARPKSNSKIYYNLGQDCNRQLLALRYRLSYNRRVAKNLPSTSNLISVGRFRRGPFDCTAPAFKVTEDDFSFCPVFPDPLLRNAESGISN